MRSVVDLLRVARGEGASDLHLVTDYPPFLRVNGDLKPIEGSDPMSPEEVQVALDELATPAQAEAFKRDLELDFSYSLAQVGRLRCNAARQRGSISFAIRLLPPEIPTIDELNLPMICKELAMCPRGLVVISGPTGAGKSSTQASMIGHINAHKACHVVTIEDPIEYTHTNINSAITQRELGADTHSFAEALKHVLRQDPDVIMVGEMRDLETASAVLTIAESGHLVLTTGHATSAYQCVERIVDLFPPDQRYLAQNRLASLIVGVLCQILVPRADGSGRSVAVEIMIGNVAVKNLIREGKIYQIPNVIRTSSLEGMETLDQALVRLYLRGMVTLESVGSFCNDKEEVERLIGKMPVLARSGSRANAPKMAGTPSSS